VAQGTVDKRFLRKFVKAVSAGALLALAVIAVLLAGCGGSSSDNSGSTVAAGTSAESGSTGAGGSSGADAGGGRSGQGTQTVPAGGAGEPGGSGGSNSQSPSGHSPSSGRHGPPVPMPKGEPEPGITPQQRREATVASIRLDSPSVPPSSGGPGALPALYTCDGKSTSPALHWQGVPEGTAELALLAMNLQPVQGKLFFNWAVAGISPELEEIKAGQLPKGAVVGRNSFGKVDYELCPEGGGETYMFALFALPKKLSPSRGFDPLVLRKEVTDSSGNVGLLAVSYTRG
jgi:phosphatidylethanolamine-binding protein (PEBP) family uncharacterized protein